MDLGLKGRVAVITGARRGIGRAEAVTLAREGAHTIVTDIVIDHDLEAVVAEIESGGGTGKAMLLDVADEAAVKRIVDQIAREFGTIDILINNAGLTGGAFVGPNYEIPQMAREDWRTMLDVSLTGSFLCMKYVVPHMRDQKWGRIVNTSSIHGQVGGGGGSSHYAAAKAGIIGLTKAAAKELGPHGITVNAVAPGYVDTETLRESITEESATKARAQIPVQRFGQPEELAALVAFLVSQQAGYINGAVIDFNGGQREYAR